MLSSDIKLRLALALQDLDHMSLRTTLKFPSLMVALVMGASVNAQNWTVGEPVDMLLYSQTFYGGCDPDPDYTFNLAPCTVSGVAYKAVITAIVPPTGHVNILPGLTNGIVGNGIVIDAAVERGILMSAGTNSAVIEFRATGMPTVAGQTHPCSASAFWMSNMMFCPEGLTPVVDDNCTVQLATGVNAVPGLDTRIQWPTAANGQQLVIDLPGMAHTTARVLDVNGRVVARRDFIGQGTINLAGEAEGIYVLSVSGPDGKFSSQRFTVLR